MFRRCLLFYTPERKILTCAQPFTDGFKSKIQRVAHKAGHPHYKHSVFVMSREKYQQDIWKEKGLFVYTAGFATPIYAIAYYYSA